MPKEIPEALRTDPNKPLTREATIAREGAIDTERRTVTVSFSSETPVTRYDWWTGEEYQEILAHDEGNYDLERINSVGVVAFNHDTWSLPLGSVEKAWIDKDERRGYAVLRFDEDEEADKVFQKICSGTLRGVSFRYSVGVWEDVKAGKTSTCGRFAGPCKIGRNWTPYEIGPVGIPADHTVGPGRSEDETPVAAESRSDIDTPNAEVRGDLDMDDKNIQPVNEAEVRAAAEAATLARVTEIMDICRHFEIDSADYIKSNMTPDAVRKAVIDKLAEERKAISTVKVVKDAGDNFREAAIAGLGQRVGLDIKADGSSAFRRQSLLRFAEECLERSDAPVSDNKEQLVRDAISMSPDFTAVMENIAHKKLAQGFEMAPTTFQLWTGKGNLSDFRAESRVSVSEFDDLEQILPAQAYQLGKMSDQKVSVSLAKYGKKFCLTWEDIINDNLSALNDIPMKQGAACKRLIEKAVYKVLTDNSNMPYDTTALFEASKHKNYTSSGTAISVTSLGVARALMRKQTNIGGKESLNISPAFLIVPAELETLAEQTINSVVDPAMDNATVNPFANKLRVVCAPVLTSATEWYLAAAPGLIGTVEVDYLDGNEAPYLERRQGFDVDGIEFKVRQVFGVAALDHRGLYKNAGA